MLPSKIEPVCQRCGDCCRTYTFWLTNRSFDNDPKEIKRLAEYHNLECMKNAKGELGIKIPMTCIHLKMVDGKSECAIQDDKPVVCREYFCGKAIAKALEGLTNGVCV